MIDPCHIPRPPRVLWDLLDTALLLAFLGTAEAVMFAGRTIEFVRGRPFATTGTPTRCSRAFCYQHAVYEVDRWWGRGWVCSEHKEKRDE